MVCHEMNDEIQELHFQEPLDKAGQLLHEFNMVLDHLRSMGNNFTEGSQDRFARTPIPEFASSVIGLVLTQRATWPMGLRMQVVTVVHITCLPLDLATQGRPPLQQGAL
jgi:hypothetical protein